MRDDAALTGGAALVSGISTPGGPAELLQMVDI